MDYGVNGIMGDIEFKAKAGLFSLAISLVIAIFLFILLRKILTQKGISLDMITFWITLGMLLFFKGIDFLLKRIYLRILGWRGSFS